MSVLQQLNNEIATLTRLASESLVEVRNGRQGGGAGTVWHEQGLILTNAHVTGRTHAQVTLPDGRTFEARLLARDTERDLAALAIEANDLHPIALGDSGRLEPGEFVLALGHPWGVKGAVTAGIVMSAEDDYLRVSYPDNLVAVNLQLRPGNSGGPLIDAKGRLVGINSMMTGPDSGLAIPVNVAKAFLRERIGAAAN
jgi:serine protease Do